MNGLFFIRMSTLNLRASPNQHTSYCDSGRMKLCAYFFVFGIIWLQNSLSTNEMR